MKKFDELMCVSNEIKNISVDEAKEKLNDPNVQNPLATVAQVTNFQVTAYDSLNTACVAIDTVTCLPNLNNISFCI